MIRLDSTLREIELVLAGAPASVQPSFLATYSDASSTSYTGGTTPGVLTGVTPVVAVGAPGSGLVRDVDYLSVLNLDSAAVTLTVRYNDNGTPFDIITIGLGIGDQLCYTHAEGWRVLDPSGALRAGIAGPSGGAGPSGPAVFLVAEDPLEALDAIPGRVGDTGAAGAAGAPGPTGPAVFLVADEPDEPPMGIPGSQGAQGATGAVGPVGPATFLTAPEQEDPVSFYVGGSVASSSSGTSGAGTVVAWVNFNGSGTVAIRASGNVSSITDNGTGDYTVNFTAALTDANYSVTALARNYTISFNGADVITTTTVRFECWFANSTSGGRSQIDSSYTFVTVVR